MTDQALLDTLRARPEEGMEALCAAYASLAAAVARRVLPDRPEDVEEAAADALLALWNRRGSLRPETLRGFLITAARNAAIDRWRVLRRRSEVPLFDHDREDSDYLESEVFGRDLQERILRLSPPDGEIFLRHYLLLESAGALAARFGLTEGAVRARLHRARDTLKKEVCAHD